MMRLAVFYLLVLSVGICGVLPAGGADAAGEAEAEAEGPTSANVLTNAVLQKIEYPRSEFVIEPSYGKDPFHPASGRRTSVTAEAPVPGPTPTVAVTAAPPAVAKPAEMVNTFDPAKVAAEPVDNELAFLSVKGIIATTSSRVITLHTTVRSYIFRTGDSMTVRVPDGRMRVRCLEIRGRSGVFQIEGRPEPVELHLRED